MRSASAAAATREPAASATPAAAAAAAAVAEFAGAAPPPAADACLPCRRPDAGRAALPPGARARPALRVLRNSCRDGRMHGSNLQAQHEARWCHAA